MNAVQQLLTDHIDIWTAAETEKRSGRGRASNNATSVYGIKKLRELILDLAVRGKLVPQNDSDEPANELLKRIQNEKSTLVAEGKFKKEKALSPIAEDQKYFELPLGWEWAKLGDVAYSQAGFAFKSNGFNETGTGLPLIRIRDVGQTFTGTYFDGEYREEFVVQEGDYLISMDGEFRVSKWLNGTALLNQRVSRLIFPGTETAKRFVVEALQKELRGLQGKKSYTTVDHLSGGQISNSVIALPPLNEQHRIVAKIDELMALCDQLEAQHSDAADAHEQLVSHLLGMLTQSQSAADFNANWQRIAAHFDTLFTTEASIEALKKTLLQLAVKGKLVAENANDEPASELLKRIKDEKAKLIAEGKIRKDKSLPAITEDEKAFELPEKWEWSRLSEITTGMDSGWSPACLENNSPSDDIWGVLKTTAVQEMEFLEFENKELPENLLPRPDAEVKAGDILFTRAGPINRVAISCFVRTTRPKLMISDKIIRFHPIESGLDGQFLTLCLNTGATAIYLEKAKSGMAASQVNISQEKLRYAPIPVPPLAMQKKIVEKVDELTKMCEKLKSLIINVNQYQKKLADVLVEHAVDD